jgi:hypothetical protein
MLFKENDLGHFWLSTKEKLLQSNDEIQPGEKNKQRFRKDELVKKLAEAVPNPR